MHSECSVILCIGSLLSHFGKVKFYIIKSSNTTEIYLGKYEAETTQILGSQLYTESGFPMVKWSHLIDKLSVDINVHI